MLFIVKSGTHHHFLSFLTKTDLTHSFTSCAASPPHPELPNDHHNSASSKKICSLWNKPYVAGNEGAQIQASLVTKYCQAPRAE